MSENAALHAISPIDGRYRRHTEPLAAYFSEAGLIQYRIRVEVEYFGFSEGARPVSNVVDIPNQFVPTVAPHSDGNGEGVGVHGSWRGCGVG